MFEKYRGELYRDAANPDLVEFAESGSLHALDFPSLLDFYEDIVQAGKDADLAYLGAVDRFYLLTNILARYDALHPWLLDRTREVEDDPDGYLDIWAREHYKMLRVDEPVPTPSGWREHGSLRPGDWIFGPDGDPTRVVACTQVFTDGEAYEITFDDGTKMQAGADHLWSVERKTRKRTSAGGRIYRETVTISTRDMAALDHRSDNRLAIAVNAPIRMPAAILLISPYVLGAWIGDGNSVDGRITCGDQDVFDAIRAEGWKLSENGRRKDGAETRTVYGLRPLLRGLGMLGSKAAAARNIPMDYLRGSAEQRLELLRGLMDSDGHCNTRGTATFTNKTKEVAQLVYDLATGLGMKPQMRGYKADHGAFWQVSFQAYQAMPPFRVGRKVARCKAGSRNARRFVISVKPIAPTAMSCIQVDRPDGLYLAGRQMVTTHNSTIITYAGSIQEILNDPEITIGIFSHTKGIAKKFVAQIKREFESNADMRSLYPRVCWLKPRSEAPIWAEDAFTIRRKSNPKESTVEGHGVVDGQPTSKHFKLLVYDDVVTLESVTNPDMVKKTTEAWELSTNLGADEGRMWMPGTRYSFGDTYGDLIARDVVKVRKYPATHNGKMDGTPVFMTPAAWEIKKKRQRSTVAAQMLQDPLSGKERMFEPEWFTPWFIRPSRLNVYIMADPSRGRTAKSDNTAIAVIGIDVAGNKYLLDGARHRMKLSQRWDYLKHFWKKWTNTPGINMVKVGYERFGQQSDDEYFEERMRIEGTVFKIHELAWPREGSSSKRDRVERLQPDIEYATFRFPAFVSANGGESLWEVNPEEGLMRFEKPKGELKIVTEAKANGRGHLVAKPIVHKDENGAAYDLTRALMDELIYFPFGTRDDLCDAASRIYDIEAFPAITGEEVPELPATVD